MIVSEIKVKHIKEIIRQYKFLATLNFCTLCIIVPGSGVVFEKKLSKLSHGIQGCAKIEQTMITEHESLQKHWHLFFGMPALGWTMVFQRDKREFGAKDLSQPPTSPRLNLTLQSLDMYTLTWPAPWISKWIFVFLFPIKLEFFDRKFLAFK